MNDRTLITALAISLVAGALFIFLRSCKTTLPITAAITNTTVTQSKKHKQTVTVTLPDGTKKTTITEDSSADKAVPNPKKTNISALVGIKFERNLQPLYGISVTREVLGPITVGAYGLTNGVVGLSVGVNF